MYFIKGVDDHICCVFQTADLIVYPSVAASLLKYSRSTHSKNGRVIIVLIHPPDHYDRSGQHLNGRQAMRIRHFKTMGFRVMNVKFSKASQLKMMPQQVKRYLQSEYDKALSDE